MIYMVEFDFSEPMLLDEWNTWYEGKVRQLLKMPGFNRVQRFKAVGPVRSPHLAIYDIESKEVFSTPEYLAHGGRSGPGKWAPLMTDWDRNLFVGVEAAPSVPADSVLVIVDRRTAEDAQLQGDCIALDCVGLDQTVMQRGLTVCTDDISAQLVMQAAPLQARVFKPLWPQMTKCIDASPHFNRRLAGRA